MSTLQVRNLPRELHAKLAERSSRLGVSMSEYVTRVLWADLERPLFDDWAAGVRVGDVRDIDVAAALDAARDEYDPGVSIA
jgi:plasmid stability protein